MFTRQRTSRRLPIFDSNAPFRQSDHWARVAKSKSEYRVSCVVPVNHDLAAGPLGCDLDDGQSWDRGRVLGRRDVSTLCTLSFSSSTHLNKEETRSLLYPPHQRPEQVESGCDDLERRKQEKDGLGHLADPSQWCRKIHELDFRRFEELFWWC